MSWEEAVIFFFFLVKVIVAWNPLSLYIISLRFLKLYPEAKSCPLSVFVIKVSLEHNMLIHLYIIYGVAVHPADLLGLYLPSFNSEERAQSQQQRYQKFNG